MPLYSTRLRGRVYYIVGGHGGPDPVAVGVCYGKSLCEDEYAYDITLRTARNLMTHGATVYIITRDPNDGIRDEVSLQSKFQRLVQHPKGTGDPNCSETVIRAKRLERKRIEKAKIKPLGAKSKRTVILISKRMHKWMQRRHFLSPRRRTLTPSRSTMMRLALFKFMQPQPAQMDG